MNEPIGGAGEGAVLGLIGLGVMGQNLALNMTERGFRVAAFEPLAKQNSGFAASVDDRIMVCETMADLVACLTPPRAFLLMLTAGDPVDQQLDQLAPLLAAGDVVIDGGNSHYGDTQRRYQALSERGLHYLGIGVSGGEHGARTGPALMAGGSEAGYRQVEPLLRAIAAKVDGEPCCTYLGAESSGHFVKMMHNGIEYADLQLIAEAYDIMSNLKLSASQMQQHFSAWNEGELQSYLIEITAQILGTEDPDTGKPLVDVILDRAGQKGTGRWASQSALELGISAPTIIEAVNARALSAIKEQRLVAEQLLEAKTIGQQDASLLKVLPDALLGAKVCAYAQGFAVLRAASVVFEWDLRFAEISRVWQGGCIIRARFLQNIDEAYQRNPKLYNLLFDPYFQLVMQRTQLALRRVVATAVASGVPVPAMASALGYFDAFRRGKLPANLIQAQRDYFGTHGYQRTDRQGLFHHDWRNRIG